MGVPAIALTQASQQRFELVDEAARAGEVVLTRGVAQRPGSARGQVHMAEDFDATPVEFRNIAR